MSIEAKTLTYVNLSEIQELLFTGFSDTILEYYQRSFQEDPGDRTNDLNHYKLIPLAPVADLIQWIKDCDDNCDGVVRPFGVYGEIAKKLQKELESLPKNLYVCITK